MSDLLTKISVIERLLAESDKDNGYAAFVHMRRILPEVKIALAPKHVVAWRSRAKGSMTWEVHTSDPTQAISRYAVAGLDGYDVEPLYAHTRADGKTP